MGKELKSLYTEKWKLILKKIVYFSFKEDMDMKINGRM